MRAAGGLVVDHHVAGVDLDQIVNEEHLNDPVDIDFAVGVFGEGGRHQGNVLGVLGIVLAAGAAFGKGGAQDGFEAILFDEKVHLPAQAFVGAIVRQAG